MEHELRKRAEAFINANPVDTPVLSTAEVQELFRELDVKQLELAMQNEELQSVIEELQAARDDYAMLYEAAPVGYLIVDRSSTILKANAAAAKLLKMDRARLVGRRFSEFIPPAQTNEWIEHCHEVLSGCDDHAVDIELHKADGVTFDAQLICRPRPGEAPEDWRCLQILTDTTARKCIEDEWLENRKELQGLNRKLEEQIKARTGELRESEARFRSLFKELPAASFLLDLDGYLIDGNHALESQIGYTRDELVGQSLIESAILPPAAREQARERMARLIEKGQLEPTEYELVCKDGSGITVEVTSRLVRIGSEPAILCSSRDLTARKQAAAERELLDRQRRLALNAAHLGWWRYDPERKIITYDRRFAQIFGLAGTEITTAEIFRMMHPDDLAHIRTAVAVAMDSVEAWEHEAEYRIIRSDGMLRWVESHGLPMFDGNGTDLRLARFVGTVADITDRKEAEQALQESEERYRHLFEAESDAIVVFDAVTRRFLDVNEAALKLYGYTRDEFSQMTLKDITVEPEATERSVQLSLEGVTSKTPDRMHRKKDGTIFPVEISPGKFVLSGRVAVCEIIRDITERKRINDALEKRVLALTQPLDQWGKIAFEELFDTELIQQIQDEFSTATGVSSVIVRPDGTPITKPSNVTDFCFEVVRKTEKGCANCLKSDAAISRYNPGGPIVRRCLSAGLWDAGTRINVGGHHIASWLIGQVRDETQTDEHIRAYAREIGADEARMIEAFHRVPVMPRKRFESVAQALHALANQISRSAYQNVQQARFIAAQQAAEKALSQSEEQYRNLFRNISEEVHYWKLVRDEAHAIKTWRLVDINPAGLKAWNKTREEAIGKTPDEIFGPGSTEHFLPIVEKIYADDRPYSWETYFPGLDQHLKMTSVPAGEYFITTGIDISEIRKSERLLRESEERYRVLFEAESDAILVFDGETRRFVDINDAAARLYGYTREEFLNLTHQDVTAEPETANKLIPDILAGAHLPVFQSRHRKKDGTVFPVDISAASLELQGRKMVSAMIRDITQRVAQEKELDRNHKELRRLASELSLSNLRERQQIAAELHDGLSQLLSSASLWIDAAMKEHLPDGAERPLGKVREIINQGLELSRSLTFDLSCPMLNELGLGAALDELCSSMSQEHAMRFEFSGWREPLPMHIDQKMILYRAARELLINALKHSRAESARVRLERTDDRVRICVSDEGIGFNAAKAGSGFSPSGGFGLFNIGEYVHHMGGNLSIQSAPGGGTQVVLEVPIGQD